jgi:APA family basic amino acid/polyamine antiporter
LSGSYGELLKYCTFASLLFYIVTVLGLFMLRKREPQAERPYRVIAYPFTPALYILMAGFVAVSLLVFDWKNSLIGIGIVAAGIPIYFLIQKKKGVDN